MNLREKALVLHFLFGFFNDCLDFIGVVAFEANQVFAEEVFD